jgi:zinc transport system substrate-binding protein
MTTKIVLIIAIASLAAGCGGTSGGSDTTSVVAAFYPLAFAAERVGGPSADVENLTPPGSEPHDFELSPKAVARIQQADVVLYLGHGFQPAVSSAAKGAQGEVVDLLDGLPLQESAESKEGLSADPHVWLDPLLFAAIVDRIGRVLNAPEPAKRLETELMRLDRSYRGGLAHCARHELVTSHEAFGYLARRYDLRQVGITGLTPEAEPTARDLEEVVKLVRRTHATTIFFETLVSPRLAETVARETGADTAVLDPIEGLTPVERSRGATYLTLMRNNLAELRQALGCR